MSKQKPTHDAVYRAGSFTGRDGKERSAYQRIGAAWPDEHGHINRIRLDSIPVSWDGVIYLRSRETPAERAVAPGAERAGNNEQPAPNGHAHAAAGGGVQ